MVLVLDQLEHSIGEPCQGLEAPSVRGSSLAADRLSRDEAALSREGDAAAVEALAAPAGKPLDIALVLDLLKRPSGIRLHARSASTSPCVNPIAGASRSPPEHTVLTFKLLMPVKRLSFETLKHPVRIALPSTGLPFTVSSPPVFKGESKERMKSIILL